MSQHLRIFIGSPGDVGKERRMAREIVDKIGREPMWQDWELDPILWENQAVRRNSWQPPQKSIELGAVRPARCDLCIFILGERIGTELVDDAFDVDRRAEFGFDQVPHTGTVWELGDAMAGSQDRRPGLLILRSAVPRPPPDAAQFDTHQVQQRGVFDLFGAFADDSGRVLRDVLTYATFEEFHETVDLQVRWFLKERFEALQREEHAAETLRPVAPRKAVPRPQFKLCAALLDRANERSTLEQLFRTGAPDAVAVLASGGVPGQASEPAGRNEATNEGVSLRCASFSCTDADWAEGLMLKLHYADRTRVAFARDDVRDSKPIAIDAVRWPEAMVKGLQQREQVLIATLTERLEALQDAELDAVPQLAARRLVVGFLINGRRAWQRGDEALVDGLARWWREVAVARLGATRFGAGHALIFALVMPDAAGWWAGWRNRRLARRIGRLLALHDAVPIRDTPGNLDRVTTANLGQWREELAALVASEGSSLTQTLVDEAVSVLNNVDSPADQALPLRTLKDRLALNRAVQTVCDGL